MQFKDRKWEEKEYITQGTYTVEGGEFRQICKPSVEIVVTCRA